MKLLKVLTQRWVLVLIAQVLVALAIWLGGPYLALGIFKPLDSILERCLAIGLLLVLWIGWIQLKRWRAARAGEQLAAAATASDANQPGAAEATQVRARFEEALAALKRSRRGSRGLYDLPWYVVIGPPGAGKTTAIASSGLNFPLSKQFGKEALRGVGGTRNCDWWFTDEAVLLDTAGRYTTQDADARNDQAGWMEFLASLRRYRPRRPINGVIVALSASDLLAFTEDERRRHVEAVRRRIEELTRELSISLPVYFVLTKLDLLAGFTEFFDDLGHEGRAQVWGLTFPLEASRNATAHEQVREGFRRLLERLSDRSILRLESERDVQRRAAIAAFPAQLAALEPALRSFVSQTFGTAYAGDAAIQLRGVYLTSATQEGTPIDRLIGAMARAFGLSVRGAVIPPSQGRAYFLQRLLREVMFAESGLAGVNKRVEWRNAFLNALAIAAACVIVVAGLLALSMSYQRNRAYLAEVDDAAATFAALPALEPKTPLEMRLERLDALGEVVAVAARHEADVPFAMRWGLYEGRSMSNAADDAYVHELNAGLRPEVVEHFRSRLASYAAEPDKLYEYLKAYLMFGTPQRIDAEQLGFIGDLEWRRAFPDDSFTQQRLMTHFGALIADSERVRSSALDPELVERARNSLRQASLPVLMYSRLKLSYAYDQARAIDVGKEVGLGGDTVFVRKSGASLSQPMPALYTKPVFREVSTTGRMALVQQFAADDWVLGDDVADAAKSPRLMSELMQLYESDYIAHWDALLADLALRKTASTQDAAQLWSLLAAPTSPYKRLLALVQTHTKLVDPAEQEAVQSATERVANRTGSLGRVLGSAAAKLPAVGADVTKHFEPLHRLIAGSPAPIDLTVQKFAGVQSIMSEIDALGGPAPLQTAARLAAAFKDLNAHASTLPGPVAVLVTSATTTGAAVANRSISGDFMSRYRQQVVAECQQLAANRYPLDPNAALDLPLADFSRLFSPRGVFASFFAETLQPFVDTNRAAWRWQPEARAIGGGSAVPMQFQLATRIGHTYFPPNADAPQVQFTVTPDFLDANVAHAALELDGQLLEYRHGPPRALPMSWPAAASGQAVLTLEERSGARSNLIERGPWAVFRLFEKATIEAQGDTRFLATFVVDGKTARFVVQASSSRNPFAQHLLRGFRCQS